MNSLSTRVQRIKPSPTLAISAKAKELQAAGQDIIDLGAGEPDFDTPQSIKDAAIQAINEGFTKYTAVDGIPSLKQAIVEKFSKENGFDFEPAQILVSCGGKQSFYNLCQALLSEGDEVVIPAPYWVSYPDIALLADAKPVIINTTIEHGFKITPDQLQAALTPKTRLMVLNSPSNPTGSVYSPEELKALAEVLLKYPHVVVATDDIYEHIRLSDCSFQNILNVCPELKPQTIVLNGVSKAYSMTGWRIGYAAGPKWLIAGMKNVQSQSTSNPTSISQVAAQAALSGDQSCIAPMVAAFRERHEYIVNALNQLNGVRCIRSAGAFYSFADYTQAIANLGLKDDVELADVLMTKAAVALVPGSAFGNPGYARISFATSMENLQNAVKRMSKIL
ncbi:MAG: pyridoxal phosphate-dependent aminotransferase [Gammaproteobacteria bacterium]|nr:pyridoxal phosphate-dependent aminotransferase [Gammaproteobacteria bacterium]MDH5802094.1 pyridoxal phosphate-dependent aminotransferase [Gammaproteobacteria bacterium]